MAAWPFRGLLLLTAVSAGALVLWAVPRVDLLPALGLVVAVGVSEWFAATLRDDVRVSLTNVVTLVAVVLGGPALAIVAVLGAVPVLAVRASDRRVLRTVFNTGQFVLSAGASGALYALLTAALPDQGLGSWTLLALALASLAHSLVNHLLVAAVVSLSSSERFRAAFRSILQTIGLQVPYVGLAVVALVLLERASPWALLLLAVPMLVARRSLLAFQRLEEAYDQLVSAFVEAIEIKDPYTRGHSQRVAALSELVAAELSVPYDERRLVRTAALLHDVGKVGVPLGIINKPGALDDAEFSRIRQHPEIGARILHDIDFLAPALDIVRCHHERLDGRGYPHGYTAAELGDPVRIVTVVDAFDAMTSTRSYRRAMPVAEALTELQRCSGTQFDPRMVAALARVVTRTGWQPTVEFASASALAPVPGAGSGPDRPGASGGGA